ncbi:MAG: hypothetical protein ACYCOU_06705 [Sulfobacillus sp.]
MFEVVASHESVDHLKTNFISVLMNGRLRNAILMYLAAIAFVWFVRPDWLFTNDHRLKTTDLLGQRVSALVLLVLLCAGGAYVASGV